MSLLSSRVTKLTMVFLLLPVSFLMAGGAGEAEAATSPEDLRILDMPLAEPVEISALYKEEASYPYKPDWPLWDWIEEETNVDLQLTVVPASDFDSKAKLLITSGDAPDFITHLGDYASEFVPAGALTPIGDYFSVMPHLSEKLTSWDLMGEWETLKQIDGKIYELKGLLEVPNLEFGFAYRKDIADQLGLTPPDSYRDFEAFLQAYKEAFPESIPWTDKWNQNSQGYFWGPAWGTQWGWGEGNMMYYLDERDSFVFAPTTDDHREYLRFMNGLVEKGLYDLDGLTHSSEQLVQKLITNKGFFSAANMNEVIEWEEFGRENLGEDFRYEMFLIPEGPKGRFGPRVSQMNMPTVAIPSTSRESGHFNEIISFIDWMYYSDEGMLLSAWGKESVTYERADGKRTPLSSIKYKWMNPAAPEDIRKDYGVNNVNFHQSYSRDLFYELMDEETRLFQQEMAQSARILNPAPNIRFHPEDQEIFELLGTKLKDYTQEMHLKFIIGANADIDEDWDEFVRSCEEKGSLEYTAMVNEAYGN